MQTSWLGSIPLRRVPSRIVRMERFVRVPLEQRSPLKILVIEENVQPAGPMQL